MKTAIQLRLVTTYGWEILTIETRILDREADALDIGASERGQVRGIVVGLLWGVRILWVECFGLWPTYSAAAGEEQFEIPARG